MQCGIGNVRARRRGPVFPCIFLKITGGKDRRPATTCRRAFARKRRNANVKSARAASRGSPDLAADNRAEQDENRQQLQPLLCKTSRSRDRERVSLCSRVPGAAQHEVVLCRPGTVPVSGGPGSAVYRFADARAAPRPGHAIARTRVFNALCPAMTNAGLRIAPRADVSHVRVAIFIVNNRPETMERIRPHVKVGSSHGAAVLAALSCPGRSAACSDALQTRDRRSF
jgi:hypothetical protein